MSVENQTARVKKLAIVKWLCNPIAQLLMVFGLVTVLYDHLSFDAIRFFLTFSVCMRELLVFVLPFLLFSFVAVALSSIPREGMLFVLGLMAMVFISNFLNILISGSVGFCILSDLHTKEITTGEITFTPLFCLNLPHIISTSYALLVGIIVGLYNAYRPQEYISKIIHFLHDCVLGFMKKFFIPLLPLFVGGFLLKLFAEGKMVGFMGQNTIVCLMMCSFLVCYLLLWLLVAAKFKLSRAVEILKNTLPAVVTAFSTMSSAAALPLSLNAAEKNTRDKALADAVMPLTLNFHMVGDTIIVPIMAMLVMLSFNHPLPSIFNFIMFGLFFVLNKFAGGGVPSGTIMVTIPVLKEHFGFDDAMIAFIVAFYGIVDPIATAGNVAANNIFVLFFQKIHSYFKKKLAIVF
ncbi:MAG: cation:dicarboxylase symporter family transporter [Holosporaceae bacterium]|nr:cation:dicarboxylase symporter family transporter [Holosporaceae bacterium]